MRLAQTASACPLRTRAAASVAPRRAYRLGARRRLPFLVSGNIDALAAAGADVVLFSPLHDPAPPDIDAIWLGGGPEHFGAPLAANTAMRAALQAHAARGLPIYAMMRFDVSVRMARRPARAALSAGGADPRGDTHDHTLATIWLCRGHVCARHAARSRQHHGAWPPFSLFDLRAGAPLPCAYRITRATTGETHYEGFWRDHVLATYLHASIWAVSHTWRSTLSTSAVALGMRH